MDRGEHTGQDRSDAGAFDGVAAGASARVGEILREAEGYARECEAEAERAAAAAERGARTDAERLFDDARTEAERVARDRADHLAAIQASLTARGPAVLEGLEGAGATRARLEELIEALAATADRVVAEAASEPEASAAADEPGASPAADHTEPEASPAADHPEPEASPAADPEPEPGSDGDGAGEGEDSAAAEASHGDEDEAPADVGESEETVVPVVTLEAPSEPASKGEAVAGQEGNGSSGPERARYEGPIPEGAPLARRPKRTKERDVRFAALLLALQGRERAEVEEQLCSEFGLDEKDCQRVLDEVFGSPADTRA